MIVCDEEEHLPGALASVAFCDEVVVVDSGSTDRTVEIARAAGAAVVEHPWSGFAAQRNVAIDHATGDWVLEVDADERITPALAEEILAFLRDPPADVDLCALPMAERVGRHEVRASAKYPFYRFRLFRREAHRHDEGRLVHEGLEAHGRVHAMRADMIHLLADGPRELAGDAWRYAKLHAGNVPRPAGARGYAVGMVGRPLVKTAFRLVVDGGWRDGLPGLARILTDTVGDALVWARIAAGRSAGGGDRTGSGEQGSIAHHVPRADPVRVVGVADGAPATADAAAWLAELAERTGADVVLVTPAPGHADGQVPVVAVRRASPLRLARALDALNQARVLDAILVARPRIRRRLALVPPAARGLVRLTLEDEPGDSVARVRDARPVAPAVRAAEEATADPDA